MILYIINVLKYDQREAEGDLARMGYFYSNPSPKSTINSRYILPQQYTFLSDTDLSTEVKTDVLTIGDSFSEQDSLGYQNFLASKGTTVVHVDRFISGSNPIQTLVEMVNSGIFDIIHPEFIVLQSTQRDFNGRTRSVDFDESLDLEVLSRKIKEHKPARPNYNLQFFSDATLKMPLNNLQFRYTAKPLFSNTYKVKTTSQKLFSNTPDHLLFYKNDLNQITAKNDSLGTLNSIQVLNKLSKLLAERDIELIVLVSPDKYDLYYPYIEEKSKFTQPTFFSLYEPAEKGYANIDTYRILSKHLVNPGDIYYYDDTHWSPVATEIIADELHGLVKK